MEKHLLHIVPSYLTSEGRTLVLSSCLITNLSTPVGGEGYILEAKIDHDSNFFTRWLDGVSKFRTREDFVDGVKKYISKISSVELDSELEKFAKRNRLSFGRYKEFINNNAGKN